MWKLILGIQDAYPELNFWMYAWMSGVNVFVSRSFFFSSLLCISCCSSACVYLCVLNEQRNWWQVEKRKEKRTGRRCTMNSFWCRCAWCLFFIDSLNVCNGEEFTEKNYLPWIWKVICNRNNAMQCYKLHFTFAHSFSWFICDIVDGRPF